MAIPDRYHRQRLVEGFGDAGQSALSETTIAIVGLGALGCLTASMLARAGIGSLILIDRDIVELTNLQRQLLYTEEDAAKHLPKALAAKLHLEKINSEINVTAQVVDLTHVNAELLLESADIIIDGLDHFTTRYILNDVAVKYKKPFLFAGVIAGQGNVMSIVPSKPTPCLRCVFPEPPPNGSQDTCDTTGVLAPAIGIAASCQTMDALKYATGHLEQITNTLLTFDLWNVQSNRLDIGLPNIDCQCCSKHNYEFLNQTNDLRPITMCGQLAVQIPSQSDFDIESAYARLSEHGSFTHHTSVVRGKLKEELGDNGESITLTCFEDGRVLVHGTDDIGRAKSICTRFIGI